jgi:type I restriction enzyme S subunit
MTDWPVKTLGDLMSVQNGYAFDSQYFSADGTIGLIRIRDLKNGITTEAHFDGPYDDQYVVTNGDYLIGMDGEFRCYEWKGAPALLNQRVCRLRDFAKSLDARFLFYGINKFLKDIEDVTGFTTVKHLSSKSILAIEMPVPPLEEQQRIVALLDEATARITELTTCYEHARTHVNNLFTSALCGMFEAIDGKSKTQLGEICIAIVDCEHKTVPGDETGNAWAVGTRAMSSGLIDFSKAKRISDATYAEWTRRMVPRSGDLILAREAPVGPVVQVPESPKVALGQRTVLIRPDNKVAFTPYLHYLLTSEPIQRSMHFKSEGSVVSHLNVRDVRLLMLPLLPSLDEQKRIVARLDAMRAKTSEMVATYDAKLQAAKDLRQSILEAAFAGEL